jgi:hypothetical protein
LCQTDGSLDVLKKISKKLKSVYFENAYVQNLKGNKIRVHLGEFFNRLVIKNNFLKYSKHIIEFKILVFILTLRIFPGRLHSPTEGHSRTGSTWITCQTTAGAATGNPRTGGVGRRLTLLVGTGSGDEASKQIWWRTATQQIRLVCKNNFYMLLMK